MFRNLVAALLLTAAAIPAGAQSFPVEFWPPTPNRTRQVQHWISCPVGARLEFRQSGAVPSNAVVGGFVFVGKGAPAFLGLYRIDVVEVKRKPDGTVESVRIVATCTTGLDG